MADEPVRRSGRATKGQHTKNSEDDSAAPSKRAGKSKGKGKNEKSESEENEDDAIIRCVCGTNKDEDGWSMICCDKCEAWQHNLCMGITEETADLPEHYFCEQCRPQDHKDLLAAIKRGEKPWETRIQQRREQEAETARRKKGKGKRKSAGTATPKETPAKTTPVPESTNKRKFEDSVPAQVLLKSASPTVATTPSISRRKSSVQVVVNDAKRRKSTVEAVLPRIASGVFPLLDNIDDLPHDRVKGTMALQTKIKQVIDRLVKFEGYRIPDGETALSLANTEALKIEHALMNHFGEVSAYADQFRSISFNIGKNPQIVSRLLSTSLSAAELAEMSTSDMASEELQKHRAAIKEEADKQAVLITEQGPRMRKTHKGDEMVGEEVAARPTDDSSWATQPLRRQEMEDEIMADDDDNGSDHGSDRRVELEEDAVKPPLTVDTSGNQTRKPSNFDLGRAWQSAHSPNQSYGVVQPSRSQHAPAHSPDTQMHDADIDRLLKDEDDLEDIQLSPTVNGSANWKGRIDMAGVAAFNASARWVAGGDVGRKIPYADLLPRQMEITGRIAIPRADEYVANMRFSNSNDVCCLAITPSSSSNDHDAFSKTFEYFHSKERWGVISMPGLHDAIRDIYVVTLEAGMASYPDFLTMLDDRTIEEPRRHNMLILTLVVKTRSPQTTPRLSQAPSETPLPAGAPAPSPVVAQVACGNGPPSSYPWATEMVKRVLGPDINAPAVVQLFTAVPEMTEQQVINLKGLLDREPSAREDLGKLADCLSRPRD